MWKKNDETDSPSTGATAAPRPAADPTPRSAHHSGGATTRSAGSPAIIGESIRVQGEIHGSEDLLVEGEVDGQIHLDDHSVTVGRSGRVKADIHGGVLVVEGKVQGNLFAQEQAVVRASGEVRGNITSPRVSLEDGAKFKGSIDMEPRSAKASSASSSTATSASASSGDSNDRDKDRDSKQASSDGSGKANGSASSAGAANPAATSGSGSGGDKKAASGAAAS